MPPTAGFKCRKHLPPSLSVPPSRSLEPSFNPPVPCARPLSPRFLAVLLFHPTSSRLYQRRFFRRQHLPCPPFLVVLDLSPSPVSSFLSFFPSPPPSPHSTSFFFSSTAAPLSPPVRFPFLPLPLLREHPFLQSEVSSTRDSLRILIVYREERRARTRSDLRWLDFNLQF